MKYMKYHCVNIDTQKKKKKASQNKENNNNNKTRKNIGDYDYLDKK